MKGSHEVSENASMKGFKEGSKDYSWPVPKEDSMVLSLVSTSSLQPTQAVNHGLCSGF